MYNGIKFPIPYSLIQAAVGGHLARLQEGGTPPGAEGIPDSTLSPGAAAILFGDPSPSSAGRFEIPVPGFEEKKFLADLPIGEGTPEDQAQPIPKGDPLKHFFDKHRDNIITGPLLPQEQPPLLPLNPNDPTITSEGTLAQLAQEDKISDFHPGLPNRSLTPEDFAELDRLFPPRGGILGPGHFEGALLLQAGLNPLAGKKALDDLFASQRQNQQQQAARGQEAAAVLASTLTPEFFAGDRGKFNRLSEEFFAKPPVTQPNSAFLEAATKAQQNILGGDLLSSEHPDFDRLAGSPLDRFSGTSRADLEKQIGLDRSKRDPANVPEVQKQLEKRGISVPGTENIFIQGLKSLFNLSDAGAQTGPSVSLPPSPFNFIRGSSPLSTGTGTTTTPPPTPPPLGSARLTSTNPVFGPKGQQIAGGGPGVALNTLGSLTNPNQPTALPSHIGAALQHQANRFKGPRQNLFNPLFRGARTFAKSGGLLRHLTQTQPSHPLLRKV